MSNQYIYTDNNNQQIIIQGGAIIWGDQQNEDSSLHYFDANNESIISSNDESYVTAIDETQYLSVLEDSDAHEVTLEDLHNLTISNSLKAVDNSNEDAILTTNEPYSKTITNEEKNDDDQVIVFTIDGSDDLYGIQMTKDEAGNVQKYQFKFRTTSDGQLEPIPETVTLLEENLENQVAVETEEDYLLVQNDNNGNLENMEHVYIKGESQSPVPESVPDGENIQTCEMEQNGIIKEEAYLSSQNGELEENIFEAAIENEEQFEVDSKMQLYQTQEGLEQSNVDHKQLVQNFLHENNHIEVQFEKELELENNTEETKAYENPPEIESEYLEQHQEIDEFTYLNEEIVDEEVPVEYDTVQRLNILKDPQCKDKTKKPLVNVKYYVMYPEKENVNSLADNDDPVQTQLVPSKLPKVTNPRSVLRTSFVKEKDKTPKKCTKNPDAMSHCEFYHKRFAKNKDAMRVKNFHYFLNKTTIPHAPVRQKRQPRKQEMKPVSERGNEEIIVQEVIVSSDGFIQNFNKNKKMKNKKVQVTAVVELSDSEDDSSRTNQNKAVNSQRKSADFEDPEISIIEINSDTEDCIGKSTNKTNHTAKTTSRVSPNTLKRRRGRPPKHKKGPFGPKRNKTETVTVHSDKLPLAQAYKKEIICPSCPKTFPSQNSLNTHLIHHNLENNLKNKTRMNSSCIPRQSLLPKFEYNHKCDDCQESFKNTILLRKHKCTKKQAQTSHNCSVCLKTFRDVTLLNIHKKSHAKANLVKNTSILNVSPKKIISKPSTLKAKSSMKYLKCTECPKICTSEEMLTNHLKTHKKFVCSSCFATFSSKFLLETHVRTNCIKLKPANNRRLSFTIKKSFINTPPRRTSIAKSADKNNALNKSILAVKLDCDQCELKFSTFRALYTHKVQKHGLNTPDKSLLTMPKQGNYKPKATHGGIPANDRLKKAYAALRKKLAESGDLVVQ